MKLKITLVLIAIATVVLNCIPAVGEFIIVKTGNLNHFDSVLHAIYYFMIGILIASLPWLKKKNLLLIFLALFLFSLLIEIIQGFIPGRTFSISDILSNSLGICVAYILQRLSRRSGKKSLPAA